MKQKDVVNSYMLSIELVQVTHTLKKLHAGLYSLTLNFQLYFTLFQVKPILSEIDVTDSWDWAHLMSDLRESSTGYCLEMS
jgi:hypothetical protein